MRTFLLVGVVVLVVFYGQASATSGPGHNARFTFLSNEHDPTWLRRWLGNLLDVQHVDPATINSIQFSNSSALYVPNACAGQPTGKFFSDGKTQLLQPPMQFSASAVDFINYAHSKGIKVVLSLTGNFPKKYAQNTPGVSNRKVMLEQTEEFLETYAMAGSEVLQYSGLPFGKKVCPQENIPVKYNGVYSLPVGIDQVWVDEPGPNEANFLNTCGYFSPANKHSSVGCVKTGLQCPYPWTGDQFKVTGTDYLVAHGGVEAAQCVAGLFNEFVNFYHVHRTASRGTGFGITISIPGWQPLLYQQGFRPDFMEIESYGFGQINSTSFKSVNWAIPGFSHMVWSLADRGALCDSWLADQLANVWGFDYWNVDSKYCYLTYPTPTGNPEPNIPDCGSAQKTFLAWATAFAEGNSDQRTALCAGHTSSLVPGSDPTQTWLYWAKNLITADCPGPTTEQGPTGYCTYPGHLPL